MDVPTTHTPQHHRITGQQQPQRKQQIQRKDEKDHIHLQHQPPTPHQILVPTITMEPPATMTIAITLTIPHLMTKKVSFRGKRTNFHFFLSLSLLSYSGDPDMNCSLTYQSNPNFDPAKINQTNILNVTKVLWYLILKGCMMCVCARFKD